MNHLSRKYAEWIAERFEVVEGIPTATIESFMPRIQALVTADQWGLVIKLLRKAINTKEQGLNPHTGQVETIPPVVWVAIELASLPLKTEIFKALILNLVICETLGRRIPKGEGRFATLAKEHGLVTT